MPVIGRFFPAGPFASCRTIVRCWHRLGPGASPPWRSAAERWPRRGQSRVCQSLRAQPRVRAAPGGALFDAWLWVGVDVGGKREGFDAGVIDDRRVLALQSHLTCRQVVDIVIAHRSAVVAIDSPRCCAPEGQTARDGELQLARSICGIRWTPDTGRVHASAYY